MHAFYERIRARRGHPGRSRRGSLQARVLVWCLLTREQDYAYQQPSLTQKKLRLLEIRAGAPALKGINSGRATEVRSGAPTVRRKFSLGYDFITSSDPR